MKADAEHIEIGISEEDHAQIAAERSRAAWMLRSLRAGLKQLAP